MRNSGCDSRSAPGPERAWQRPLASRVSLITKGLKPKSLSFCPFFLLLHHRDHQAISSLTAGVLVLGMGRRRKEGRCCGQLPQRTKAPAVWNAGPFVHSADGWRDSGLRRTGRISGQWCGQDELQRKIKGVSSPWVKVWCVMEMCESRASWKIWGRERHSHTLRPSSVLSVGIIEGSSSDIFATYRILVALHFWALTHKLQRYAC